MLYAIEAMEQQYGGYHGMVSHDVVDCSSFEEAEEYGRTYSLEVIEDYGLIEEFENDAADEGFEPETEEFDNYVSERINEDITFNIFKVRETDLSVRELNNLFNDDPEEFIKNYCIEL